RDRGGGQAEPLHEPSPDGGDPLLLDVEDGLEVLLGRIVHLGHGSEGRRASVRARPGGWGSPGTEKRGPAFALAKTECQTGLALATCECQRTRPRPLPGGADA